MNEQLTSVILQIDTLSHSITAFVPECQENEETLLQLSIMFDKLHEIREEILINDF